MSLDEFSELFASVLEQIANEVGETLGARRVTVSLQGPSTPAVSVRAAAEQLYVDENRFWRIIDVGLFETTENYVRFVVIRTGFPAGPWEKTWNAATGWGPFKKIIYVHVRRV